MLPLAAFSITMSSWVQPGGQRRSHHRHPRGDSLSQSLWGGQGKGTRVAPGVIRTRVPCGAENRQGHSRRDVRSRS